MSEKNDSNRDDCIMKCPDCHHEMNVCRTRIKSATQPHCPGCGAALVPLGKVENE